MNKYVGKCLDERYEIRELIGIGGMADVYKAYDLEQEREVAIKILKDEYLTNEDFKRRFRNESKAIAVLSHPNIVKIFDVSFGDKIQFIVMEYVNGITLKEYIEQQKLLTWKQTIHFTVQILRALQHAHDNGIVHRDVKPQNVMLLQDGTVKVMDFGIARFARDNGRTISEKAIGSVHYISPEQAKGEATDERTDIYSVGVMMFEMLTGKLPFDGDSPVTVALKQMQEEAAKPRDINPDIPEGLEEIVIRAMKKDPDLRYQTAAEMLRDLDEFKRNPTMVFDYRYFPDDESTRYFDVIGEKGEKGEKKPKDKKNKKKMSPILQILLAVAGACVVVAIIALIIFFTAIRKPTPEITMFYLEGLVYEEVINDPTYDVIDIVKTGEELSEEYEAGKIISQSVAGGKKVKEGQKISVVVSSGLKVGIVPDVVGLDKDEAQQILEEAGYEVDLATKFDSDVPENQVISTTPKAEEEAVLGSRIKVYYSKGSVASETTVPTLTGFSESRATEALTMRGLQYKITEKDSAEPKGIVVGQSIQGGERVNTGTLIEVYVSTGEAPTNKYTLKVPMSGKLVNKNVTFEIFVDGTKADSVTLNPSKSKELTWEAEDFGTKTIVIRVNGSVFAQYSVNYDEETQSLAGSIQYKLITAEAESSTPSKPESSTSSKPESSTPSQSESSATSSESSESEEVPAEAALTEE